MRFKTKRRVNFYDCDPAGIMFYGHAFYLIHSAYEEMIHGIKDYWTSEKYVVPITHSETDYIQPILPGEEVEIEVMVSSLKERSFELSYNCTGSNGEKYFTSRTIHVFTTREFRKTRIPDEVREILNSFSV